MGIIPDKNVEQVQFCESHATIWATAPTSIGLTTSLCSGFSQLTSAARKAYDDAIAARQAWHAAVLNQNTAIAAAISGIGGAADLIRIIKGFAENTANPGAIYTLAQIPAPAAPTPAPPPGLPTNVAVSLESSGAVTLTWKATNAAASTGTFFSVKRKLSGESLFMLVGNSGEKSFTDSTITLGTTGATYIIQGHRGALDGPATEQIGVQFGVGGGGGISVANATLKMAA